MAQLLLLGVLAGIDNLQVAAAIGVAPLARTRRMLLVLAFAVCEIASPLIGVFFAHFVQTRFHLSFDWIRPFVVAACGLAIVWLALRKDDDAETLINSRWTLIGLPVSLSFDNLLIGISAATSAIRRHWPLSSSVHQRDPLRDRHLRRRRSRASSRSARSWPAAPRSSSSPPRCGSEAMPLQRCFSGYLRRRRPSASPPLLSDATASPRRGDSHPTHRRSHLPMKHVEEALAQIREERHARLIANDIAPIFGPYRANMLWRFDLIDYDQVKANAAAIVKFIDPEAPNIGNSAACLRRTTAMPSPANRSTCSNSGWLRVPAVISRQFAVGIGGRSPLPRRGHFFLLPTANCY